MDLFSRGTHILTEDVTVVCQPMPRLPLSLVCPDNVRIGHNDCVVASKRRQGVYCLDGEIWHRLDLCGDKVGR